MWRVLAIPGLVHSVGGVSLSASASGESSSDVASAVALSRLAIQAEAAKSEKMKMDTHFDCKKEPQFCEAPFNCHLPKAKKRTVALEDGHPDWQPWCETPYRDSALQCQRGNLSGYGSLIHKAQLDMGGPHSGLGKMIEGVDAHYCFAFGHCDNAEVQDGATGVREMETMCDQRFGDGWRTMESMKLSLFDGRMGLYGAHLSQNAESQFAMMACAMGNYHCDAVYCRQEYCHMPKWVAKFGKIQKSVVEERKQAKLLEKQHRREVKLARIEAKKHE